MAATAPGGFSAYLDSLANFGIEPSLDGIKALCFELGGAQSKFDVIQVTGTNGKTSTSCMIQALLTANGVACGLYISPHLESYHERISVDGVQIGDDDFEAVGRLVREKTAGAERSLGGRPITQFEAITGAALAYFAQRGVQAAVLEVGMGGRWDATSVAAPKVAVITNVTMDHADWLGPELRDIADEKSYVIRDANVGIVGEVSGQAGAIFTARAKDQKAALLMAGRDFSSSPAGAGAYTFKTPKTVYPDISLNAAGRWQAANALLAAVAAEAYLGGPLDAAGAREALAAVRTPGRAELLPGAPEILLDGAHNADGVDMLVEYVKSRFAGRKVVWLAGILKDKAAPAMVAKLLQVSGEAVFTASDNPRSLAPEELVRMAAGHGAAAEGAADMQTALAAAKARAGAGGAVVVTGSLYLVGQVRKMLKNQGVIFP